MTQYKYQLDKSSKKFNCPSCNKKRFVKYIEIETDNYAENEYGRCDRETSCGYVSYPNNNSIVSYNIILPEIIKPSYIKLDVLQKTLTKYEINPLVKYLYTNYSIEDVKNTINKYKIGTSKCFNESTVFWQVDNIGKIRSGKIMAYNTNTGSRLKSNGGQPLINWVHKALKINSYNLKQCLFGLHLLNDKTRQIAIVESEKTAIIMSIELPQHTWMSTGSLQGFKNEYLEPIKKYEIIAFPDKGGYIKWNETATVLNNIGYNITISSTLEKPQYKDGWDLIDLLLYFDTK